MKKAINQLRIQTPKKFSTKPWLTAIMTKDMKKLMHTDTVNPVRRLPYFALNFTDQLVAKSKNTYARINGAKKRTRKRQAR